MKSFPTLQGLLLNPWVAVRRPVAFHSVFFGSADKNPSVLAQMSDIARDVYSKHSKARDAESPQTACTYTNAINTVGLCTIIVLNIVLTLDNPRSNYLKPSLELQSLCAKLDRLLLPAARSGLSPFAPVYVSFTLFHVANFSVHVFVSTQLDNIECFPSSRRDLLEAGAKHCQSRAASGKLILS